MIKELYEVRVNFTEDRDKFQSTIEMLRKHIKNEFNRGIAYIPVPANAQIIMSNIEDKALAVMIETKVKNLLVYLGAKLED